MTDSTPDTDVAVLPGPAPTISEHGGIEARKAFNAALALAQGEFGVIVKNRDVTIRGQSKSGAAIEYKFRYADLQEIHAKTRPALSANGLATTGQMIPGDEGVSLVVILLHAAGFERVSEVFVKYGDDIKQFGGKLSYMRRYMLQNLLDVAADDDADEDGGAGDVGRGDVGDYDRAPAPTKAPTPARKARTPVQAPATQEQGPPPEPPPEEGLSEKPPARNPATEREIQPGQRGFNDGSAREGEESKPPAAAPPPPVDPDDDGELAEAGEIVFLLKRVVRQGLNMAEILEATGYSFLDPNTLNNLTKKQWLKVRNEIVSRG